MARRYIGLQATILIQRRMVELIGWSDPLDLKNISSMRQVMLMLSLTIPTAWSMLYRSSLAARYLD
jgi:hypothetical protein